MSAGWTAFATVLGANAVLMGFLAVRVWRQSHVPGRRAFAATLFALAIWAGAYAGETLSPSFGAKTAWLKLENVGIATLVPLFFLFALRYTGGSRRATKWAAGIVCVVPVLTLLILFSGKGSRLHYASLRPLSDSGGPLVVSAGPWYHVQTVHSYLLMLAGTALILRAMRRRPERYRAPAAVLLLGIAAPWTANVFYLAGSLWPGLTSPVDLTPLAFGVLGLVYGVGVFRLRLFDLIPVARDAVLEGLPDAVVVLDTEDRVVDVNRAAVSRLGGRSVELVGRRAERALSSWPAADEALYRAKDGGRNRVATFAPGRA